MRSYTKCRGRQGYEISGRGSKGAYAEEIRVTVRDILPTITVYRFAFRNQEEI